MKQYSLFALLLYTSQSYTLRVPAVVVVPVADLAGHLVRQLSNVVSCYRTIPCAPDKGKGSCIRIHQLRANDRVTIVREFFSGEVVITVPGIYYYDSANKRRNDFWTLKRYLKPLKNLPQKLQEKIPPAITINKPKQGYTNVLTLRKPWYYKRRLYSVGTRFIRDLEKDTEQAYGVHVLDYDKRISTSGLVPKERALITYHTEFARARRVFMSLLRDWAHQPKGKLIPYVWGGFSFREPCLDSGFKKLNGKLCGHYCSFWERNDCSLVPRSGMDCSNMILYAAQMAGLPYYCKNSHVIAKTLRPLRSGEKIEEGDIIWYSGHVLVVSDVTKNLVIEAIGYDSGYGQVHEIHLSKVFQGVHNFNGLRPCHFKNKFTRRLRKDGSAWRSVYHLKILKLSSIDELSR